MNAPHHDDTPPGFTFAVLSEAERFPLLTDAGRATLRSLREHPAAPIYNHACGDRIGADALQRLREREAGFDTGAAHDGWTESSPPAWLGAAVARAHELVPFYRGRHGSGNVDFESITPIAQRSVLTQPWLFASDDADIDDLITYSTSGSTGVPCDVPAHPEWAAADIPLVLHLLRRRGISFTPVPERLAVMTTYAQRNALVFASLITYLDFAPMAKLNLHESAWRAEGDRERFLGEWDPQIIFGTPLSLHDLAALEAELHPAAIFSGALALSSGMRASLEKRFACPVFDIYGLTEAGPIAEGSPGEGWRILPRRVYVEILDSAGRPCAPGERGEITVTTDENPFLVLLRYRTGDFARLGWRDGTPILLDLEGRQPLRFRRPDGSWLNNFQIAREIDPLGIAHWRLTQRADGGLELDCLGGSRDAMEARERLESLFGDDVRLHVTTSRLEFSGDAKPYRYRSELEGAVLDQTQSR